MAWWVWLAVALAALGTVGIALYLLARILARREPYATFLRLPHRRKLIFAKLLVADSRIPWAVRALPILLIVYLANPIDLIPDFIPVVGYLDDVGIVIAVLALVVKLTPDGLITDMLSKVGRSDPMA